MIYLKYENRRMLATISEMGLEPVKCVLVNSNIHFKFRRMQFLEMKAGVILQREEIYRAGSSKVKGKISIQIPEAAAVV